VLGKAIVCAKDKSLGKSIIVRLPPNCGEPERLLRKRSAHSKRQIEQSRLQKQQWLPERPVKISPLQRKSAMSSFEKGIQ
jgi:hypothetical protein